MRSDPRNWAKLIVYRHEYQGIIPTNPTLGCFEKESAALNTTPHNPDSDSPKRLWSRIRGLIDGSYVDQIACDRAFLRMHQRDQIGDKIHLLLAWLGIFFVFGPVTVSEIAFAPLLVFFVVRIINTFPVWIHGFGQPVVLAGIALSVWMMISLSWSHDPLHGWGEIAELRWIALVGLIFPVIEKRMLLISAMCIGIAAGQLAQILDAFDGFGIEPIADLVANHPGRISGWWHPVVGGSILAGALGLHLPAAIMGQGRTRIFGLLGCVMTGVGIIATGTRGAWIASALLIVFTLAFGLISKRAAIKHLGLIALMAIIALVLAGVLLRSSIQTRIQETQSEMREILDGQYDSYTGIRVEMALVAIDEIQARPIVGVGAGGYQAWATHNNPDAPVHAHAHNGLLQVWATLGIVGVILWIVLIGTLLRNAHQIWDPMGDGIYSLSPFFAIVGILLASLTDCVQINTQSAAMIGVLSALCPAYRPGHPKWRRDKTQQGASCS